MAVPFPKVCSLLAHEMRSPLSVLQGYIRLLQQNRDADHPETPMLQAMLEATGRLTTIARQAADLGTWLASGGSTLLPVPVGNILKEVETRAASDGRIVVGPRNDDGRHVRADASALAGALVALAESMAREAGGGRVEISAGQDNEASPDLSLRCSETWRADALAGVAAAGRALALDRGGAGLALVSASYVLDAHGASLEAGRTPGSIDVHFRDTGGAS